MPKGNPQLADGYTKIANTLLDAIASTNLGSAELRITTVILRRTYGFNRKEAEISFSFFAKATGIQRRNIVRAIKNLLDRELITRSSGAKMKYGKPVYKYAIAKKSWCHPDTTASVNMTTEPSVTLTPNKETKEIFKERKKRLVDKLSIKPYKPKRK